MKKQEDKHSSRMHLRSANLDDASKSAEPGFNPDEQRPTIPLNEEQIAFFKDRMENDFYGSLEVREKIAAHLINEVFQRSSK